VNRVIWCLCIAFSICRSVSLKYSSCTLPGLLSVCLPVCLVCVRWCVEQSMLLDPAWSHVVAILLCDAVSECHEMRLSVLSLGLYRISARAGAEFRYSPSSGSGRNPSFFLQIRLISGSGQNWARFEILPDLENFHYIIQIWMIYTCKIYFQQPTALMERATLSESGSHIVVSKFWTLNTHYIVRLCNVYLKFKTHWWLII